MDASAQLWPDEPRRADTASGADGYAALHRAQRRLQDMLAGAALPADVTADVTAQLARLADVCATHRVPEHLRHDGVRVDLPGRGHPLLPPYVVDATGPQLLRGRVTFGRLHLGGNGVVHGGVQPLLFDDVLGMTANRGFERVARTAYLHVDYRWATPIEVELTFEARLDRVEGRKRFVTGELRDVRGRALTRAHALFVELRPGQP